MKSRLSFFETKFTNLDFFLNLGQVKRVALVLEKIQNQLGQVYKENRLKESQINNTAVYVQTLDPTVINSCMSRPVARILNIGVGILLSELNGARSAGHACV